MGREDELPVQILVKIDVVSFHFYLTVNQTSSIDSPSWKKKKIPSKILPSGRKTMSADQS